MKRWLLLLCMMLATSCGGPTSSSATPTRAPTAAARPPTAAPTAVATATTAASNTPTRAAPSATVRALVPATAAPTAAASGYTCDQCIKGNINSDKVKIYHLPACQDYERTVISPNQGERMFSSEAEARAAGWRKALNCP